MKSSTYGFFVMLAFLGEMGEKFDTITDLIKSADGIAIDMGCKSKNLTYMTKFKAIKELERDGLIVLHKRGLGRVVLGTNVEKFVVEWSSAIGEEDEK